MEEIKIDGDNKTIDEIYYELKYCEDNGQHAYCRKSGHTFHSEGLTLDDMYITLTGMNKEQYIKVNAKEVYTARIEQERINAKKPSFVSRGLNLIYFERFPQWEECVDNLSNNKYGANPIEIALDIMEALEHGEKPEVAAKKINSDNSKLNKLIENIVFRYSKHGPDFKEYMLGENITAEDMRKIEEVRKMNKELKNKDRKQMMSRQ